MPIKFVAYFADKADVARVKVGHLSNFTSFIFELNMELLPSLTETTLLAVVNIDFIEMDS